MSSDAAEPPADDSDHPVRPALAVLQDDQRALIRDVENDRYESEHHLRAGFPNRRAVIQWYQRAIVRTFGHIADRVEPSWRSWDGTFLSALITGPEREAWIDDPLSAEEALAYRERYEAAFVLPACNRAYNDLREKAGEYIDGDDDEPGWTDLEPGAQQHVAMRPAFRQLDVGQAEALRTLWGGFEDRQAVLDWIHGLDEPTNGAVRDDLADLTLRDKTGMGHLLNTGDDIEARRYREWFALDVLLPAFVEGVDDMSAGELAWSAGYRDQPGGFNE